jgi:hypothetical protein
MINPTSPSDRSARADAAAAFGHKFAARAHQADQFNARQVASLSVALAAQPEIRPEVVARGRELAADPAWPSPEILRQVAGFIAGSPDPTEASD